jgi:hypothetical protein
MTALKPRLTKQMNPTPEILEAINDYFILFQILEQDWYKVYMAKHFGEKGVNYSGTLGEYSGLRELKTVMKVGDDLWSPLLRAINLQRLFDPKYDITNLYDFKKEELNWFLDIVQKGFKAKEKVAKWLERIDTEYDYSVINSAVKCSFKKADEHYGQFQILKIHEFFEKNDNEKFIIIDEIFHLHSVDHMIKYLTMHKELGNCMILAVVRNEKYEWRGTFYLFFSYQGVLYTIDNQQRRINMDNTEGSRSPGRYIDRIYDDVYLPWWILFKEEDDGTASPLPVLTDPIYKLTKLTECSKSEPGILIWLEVLAYRIQHYIYHLDKVNIGITRDDSIKMLTTADLPFEYEAPEHVSTYNKGRYLFEKYRNNVTDIVLKEDNLPDVIGTEQYLRDVMTYARMKDSALQIQDMIIRDYNDNVLKVRQQISDIIESFDKEWIITKALKDLSYATEVWICGQKEEYDKLGFSSGFGVYHSIMTRRKILSGDWEKNPWEEWNNKNSPHWFFYGHGHKNIYRSMDRYCHYCSSKMKMYVKLKFIHWRQFIDFFELSPDMIPREMKDHLHTIQNCYSGNSILDDINPYDLLADPWFSSGKTELDPDDTYFGRDFREHELVIYIRICKRCYNKFKRRAEKEESDEPIGFR